MNSSSIEKASGNSDRQRQERLLADPARGPGDAAGGSHRSGQDLGGKNQQNSTGQGHPRQASSRLNQEKHDSQGKAKDAAPDEELNQLQTRQRYPEQAQTRGKPVGVAAETNAGLDGPGAKERLLQNDSNQVEDKGKDLKADSESRSERNGEQQRRQASPCLTIILFMLAMVIVAFSTFYTKIMIHYEEQNPYESFYAINALNLLFFGIIIKVKIGGQVRELVQKLKHGKKRIPVELMQYCLQEQAKKAPEEIKNEQKQQQMDDARAQAHKQAVKNFVSQEYNVLMVAKEDRLNFAIISLCLTVGLGLYFKAVEYVSPGQFSLVGLIIFGGLAPTVMNLRVRTWMAYECKIPQFIDVPTKLGLIVDVSMLIFSLAGVACTICGFGGVFKLLESGANMTIIASKQSFNNSIAFCWAILSGILLGIGLAQMRILCSFNMVRERWHQQTYNFLKPLFYTLLTAHVIVPAFMFPSIAIQEQGMLSSAKQAGIHDFTVPHYSWRKGVYFIGSALIACLCLVSFGLTLQHADVSQSSIQVCLCSVPFAVSLILEVFVFRNGHLFPASDPGEAADELLYFCFGVVLVIVPQLAVSFYRIGVEYSLQTEDRREREEDNPDRSNRRGLEADDVDF